MAIRFEIKNPRVGPPTVHMISGRIRVGHYFWNSTKSKNDPDPASYIWQLDLPGKKRAGRVVETEQAEQALREAFTDWLNNVGLNEWKLS